MKRNAIIFVVITIMALGALYLGRGTVRDIWTQWSKPALPSEQPRPSATPSLSPGTSRNPSPAGLPVSVNLAVPFVSQAPYRIWDHDHEEFCEEASTLMAVSYMKGDNSVTDPAVAERALQDIKSWELATFGYFEDTTAAQTARIITDKFGISQVHLVSNPTVLAIKTALAQGKLVLVPSAGRMLPNPNFKSPGPLYHMIMLKGYTSDSFITNDPGTRLGANFVYTIDAVMNAMHDWNGGDVDHGQKIVIIVG